VANEWKQRSTVGAGGRVEVTVPELKPGVVVEVAVRFVDESVRADRAIGFLKGRVRLAENFDDPIDDFAAYR
jgi:hypothetical protein